MRRSAFCHLIYQRNPINLYIQCQERTWTCLSKRLFFYKECRQHKHTMRRSKQVFDRPRGERSHTRVLYRRQRLLQIRTPFRHPHTSTQQEVYPTRAKRLRPRAIQRQSKKRAQIPLVNLLPLLRKTWLCKRHILPSRRTKNRRRPPILIQRRRITQLSNRSARDT